MDTIFTSAISILGVLISVTVSVIITRQQYKVELEKIKKQLEQAYAKSLFDKRVETYPQLYRLTSNYGKTIQYNKQNVRNLIKLRDEIDKWNSQYSIFFTKPTTHISWRFRAYLGVLLAKGVKSKIQEDDWNTIKRILRRFESSIKGEIGVTSIEPASKTDAAEIAEVDKFIDERIQEREIS